MNLEVLIFIFNGLLGAVLRELLEDKKEKGLIKTMSVGAIAGYMYYLLHTEHNLPNTFMALVFGYFAYDILPRTFKLLREVINNRKQL
ncbi:MAG: hypothetical protein QW607_09165 [Desulfurococcaceae archaeon]